MKIKVGAAEYRKVEGAMTWEVRRVQQWNYVYPDVAELLDALAAEMESCDTYRTEHRHPNGSICQFWPRGDHRCEKCRAHDQRRIEGATPKEIEA